MVTKKEINLAPHHILVPKNEKAEPLSLEIKNFMDAIEGKNDLLVKPEQAVNVTKIAEAALLSSQRGTPIYLDLK